MNISHQNPHRRRMPSLLAIGLGLVLVAGCHKEDEDTTTVTPPAAMSPADRMPAGPSSMTAPMPATVPYPGTGDTSDEAAPPASVPMPPPVDSQPTQDGDDASDNPAAPPDDGR
jgi:hypothetical protein